MTIYKYGQPINEEIVFEYYRCPTVIGHGKHIQSTTQFEEIRKKNNDEREESLAERSTRRKNISKKRRDRKNEQNKKREGVFCEERRIFEDSYHTEFSK